MTLPDLVATLQLHRIDSTGTIPPTLQHTRVGTSMWKCPCGRSDGTEYPHESEVCPDAVGRELHNLDVMTTADVAQGLRNIGIDPTCGACMGVFLTGANLAEHTCPGPHTEVVITIGSGTARSA